MPLPRTFAAAGTPPRNGQDRSLQTKAAAQADIFNKREIYAVGADACIGPGTFTAAGMFAGRCKHRPLQGKAAAQANICNERKNHV